MPPAHANPFTEYFHPGQLAGGFSSPFAAASPPELGIFNDRWQFEFAGPEHENNVSANFMWGDQTAQTLNAQAHVENESSNSETAQTSSHEARALFADILGDSVDPNDPAYLSKITSRLDEVIIERQDGELVKNVKKLFSSSIMDKSFELLRYSVYLSSNNLLSDRHTDKLLKWILQYKQFAVIERLIKLRKPTTDIFASNMLVSAARMKETETVCALIALGVDVNTPGGQTVKNTALYEASDNRDLDLVKLLIRAGADPNVNFGPEKQCSPLQEAIRGASKSWFSRLSEPKNRDLIRVLLEAGEDVNIAPHEGVFGHNLTILLCAVLNGDSELVQMILKAGAHVNYMTKKLDDRTSGCSEMEQNGSCPASTGCWSRC